VKVLSVECPRGPLHSISNEGALITSGVILKNPARAQSRRIFSSRYFGNERYVAQTRDDVGWRENNMNQITSIKLGLIAICFATVPLSLAQTPRTGTSRSNQTGVTTGAPVGHSGLIGNSTSAAQLNSRSSTSTAPNANAGAHIGINGGAQTGIRNQTAGTTGAAAGGLGISSGNSTGATQIGTNARSGTNTTASTNAGAHAAAAAARPASVHAIQPQLIPVPINSPSPNNSPIVPTFSTPTEFPSPSVTPTPTPAQLL